MELNNSLGVALVGVRTIETVEPISAARIVGADLRDLDVGGQADGRICRHAIRGVGIGVVALDLREVAVVCRRRPTVAGICRHPPVV